MVMKLNLTNDNFIFGIISNIITSLFYTSDKDLFANANVSKAIGFAFNYELSKDSNNYLVFTN